MIRMIKTQFAAFAARNTKIEDPENLCPYIQGGGTG
jgi:hypothetical protein